MSVLQRVHMPSLDGATGRVKPTVGVHTPEFSFEHGIDGVPQAAEVRDIDYPVAQDNDTAVWSAFANRVGRHGRLHDAAGVRRDVRAPLRARAGPAESDAVGALPR